MIHVTGLFLYPVKSLRGFPVANASVDAQGFTGDRRFLVVDESGRFLTQRTVPKMAMISTSLAGGFLQLSADDSGSITVPTAHDPSAPLVAVSVWDQHDLLAEDCGNEVAAWLGGVLGAPCRLVRMGPAFLRPVLRGNPTPDDHFSFADGAPLLVTSTASLDELNRHIIGNGGDPVPMDRFRSNLILEGTEPFAEDRWTHLDIAGVRFRTSGPCERCLVTTTDQLTGQRGKEPLKTLATFRKASGDSSSVLFGVNLIQESKSGLVSVGDPVSVTPL